MAAGKKNNRKTGSKGKKPVGVIFWLAFFILITGLFLLNRDRIRQTLENTQILTRLSLPIPGPGKSKSPEPPAKPPEEKTSPAEDAPRRPPTAPGIAETQKPPARQTPAPVKPAEPSAAPVAKPATGQPSVPAPQPAAQPTAPAPAKTPVSQPQAGRQPAAPNAPTPATPPAVSAKPAASSASAASGNSRPAADRERALYFSQVDSAGTILRTKVARRIPASDSPMVDSLRALLGGPSAEEQRRGMVSLIPKGVRILNATVRGSTAYISFSEEFQYNTYGVEGYVAQLRQIIWTATEFSNVKDVQILIEGNRVDYLGEGIWIGSPLGRESL